MAQTLFILSLVTLASGQESKGSAVDKLFNSGDILKIFGHYDTNGDGTLSSAEQNKFLDDIQKFAGVHLPSKDMPSTSSPLTVEKFNHVYKEVATDITQRQQKIQEERYEKQQEAEEKAEELQNLFQSGNIEKIFAHYDKNQTGTLDSAEQDKFLNDVEKTFGVKLPEKFVAQCKTSDSMTPQKFQELYSKMSIEFQNLQKQAQADKMKAELKKELAGMTPEQQKQLAKMYGISLPDDSKSSKDSSSSPSPSPSKSSSSDSSDDQLEMSEYDAQQPSVFTDVAVFLVSALVSAALTAAVIQLYRKVSQPPARDSYLVLSA